MPEYDMRKKGITQVDVHIYLSINRSEFFTTPLDREKFVSELEKKLFFSGAKEVKAFDNEYLLVKDEASMKIPRKPTRFLTYKLKEDVTEFYNDPPKSPAMIKRTGTHG